MLKIEATVILYNPEDDVYNNISSYVDIVDTLYVVDNSTEYNDELLDRLKTDFQNIVYINNSGNIGIATALNIGCQRALDNKANWILTMDQDSKFINFSHYIECLNSLEDTSDIALLCANTHYIDEEIPSNANCQYSEVKSAITSANLLNLKLFEQIGGFEDKLFIDVVDFDYSLKARSCGYKILYFPNIFVKHSLGTVFFRKNLITRKIRKKTEHNPQRVYYFARNYLFIASKYSKIFPKEISILGVVNMLFVHEVTKILLYEDQKLKKLRSKAIGLFHFMINKYGKYDV